jgi:hypothetical protein
VLLMKAPVRPPRGFTAKATATAQSTKSRERNIPQLRSELVEQHKHAQTTKKTHGQVAFTQQYASSLLMLWLCGLCGSVMVSRMWFAGFLLIPQAVSLLHTHCKDPLP